MLVFVKFALACKPFKILPKTKVNSGGTSLPVDCINRDALCSEPLYKVKKRAHRNANSDDLFPPLIMNGKIKALQMMFKNNLMKVIMTMHNQLD